MEDKELEKMKQDEMQRDGVKQDRMKLVIGHLYPDLLNLYGDRGNIQCFRKRLEWRGMEAEVKIRSRANPAKATLTLENGLVRVRFAEPQRAPAPGQTGAIYQGDVVLGGGFIE